MTKIISLFNNKGGVGKTTLLWNTADALARKGKHVLMIDFDPQCNLSIAVLGQERLKQNFLTQKKPYGTTLRSYLQGFLQNKGDIELFTHQGEHTHTNAKLVAGDFWLNVYAESLNLGADLLTGTGIAKYAVVGDIVDFANKQNTTPFDYALVDLPPSFGALVRAALYSSDYFIIPCTSDTFSAYCIGLISERLPIFISDWQSGYTRFKDSNPHLDTYKTLGKPKFAGWVFNGFDTRSGKYVQADLIHAENIRTQIDKLILKNDNIPKASDLSESNAMIGDIEDMNVLIQNSIWQSAPVSRLGDLRPLKNLQNKGSWAPNQIDQINILTKSFLELAENIIRICV